MLNKNIFLILIILILSFKSIFAQNTIPDSWFTGDLQSNGTYGTGVDKAYKELLSKLKANPTIVAIIDSGVEPDHEDLKTNMWVNKKEIPGNRKDDDQNGYIDDIHGWNFLGNANGENYNGDTYEVTRAYAELKKKFDGIDSNKISKSQQKEYKKYKEYQKTVDNNYAEAEKGYSEMEMTMGIINQSLDQISEKFKDQPFTTENLEKLDPQGQELVAIGRQVLLEIIKEGTLSGPQIQIDTIRKFFEVQFKEPLKYYGGRQKYAYNIEYDPRKTVVGDDPENYNDRNYGNADVEGPDAFHGTFVAGIIGGNRHNNNKLKGMSDEVLLMSIRTVPDGDERDKDVANAIRYAVDNGAKVINMSFGKGISPGKKYVDEAVKYAMKHDVLLVHAAGNSNQNNDNEPNFPNDQFEKKKLFGKKYATNWIEVGALNPEIGENMIASYSNYGKKSVDIFAPGSSIYSSIPDNSYQVADGTSFAAPMVSGLAALLRSYFPTLTATQIKKALLDGSTKIDQNVKIPGQDKIAPFADLSVTGGVLNAPNSILLAAKMANISLGN